MTSLEQIRVALDLKVLQQRMGMLESAASKHDVAGMLVAAEGVSEKVKELVEELQSIYDSGNYMHDKGGPR